MSQTQAKWGHLGIRIILVAAAAITIAFAVMIGLIARLNYNAAIDSGYQLASEQAASYAKDAESAFDQSFQLPRHLADTVEGVRRGGKPDRKQTDAIIMQMLDNAPQSIGLWMLWEPNAFDGDDNAFRLDWPRHDPSGRYEPYITRNAQGKAQMDVMMSTDRVKDFPKFKEHPETYQPDYEKPGWGDFYYVPKQRGRDTITEPYPYEVQGKKVLESSLAVVMKNAAGKMAGVSATDVALDQLQKRFGQIHPRETGYIRIASEGGAYVVHPQAELLGKTIAKDDALFSHLADIKKGQDFVYEDAGFTHFFHPIRIGDTGQFWTLGVSIPTAAITADARREMYAAITIGVVALALILLLLTVVIRALTQPLIRLAETMEQLANGGGDLTARIAIANHDEIGRTAHAFNRFLDSLRDMFAQVREQSRQVSDAAARLSQSASQVHDASTQQSDAASASAASVQQVTVGAQHIANTAQQADGIARETGTLTEQSVDKVNRVTSEIQRMTDTMHALADRMNGLGERSNEVTTIVGVIKDIADQTNLLALNAAIEAARAGEMGRGFAVVADEVRNLAGRTAEATVKITRIVEAIGSETKQAVGDVQNSRQQVILSVGIAEEANQSMREVQDYNRQLVVSIVDIAAATRQQSSASQEIAQNVERISGMAQSNNQTVREVSDAVGRLRELSGELERLVGHFKL
ncbi:methyl-accepting chemotaxis protein [Chromobacterium alticapitis]|uniref:Methyl-accepting chemotaxis protein n=1 Tax=Chromobacterium alticapitis TaxID=2073169 RepID=A0A2S5DEU5_9NEIS|nr:methyl-accepting chemotaxis protein [Chromobacterium alticapitis]POZ61623.1 methyl-accepting chemotaxis protein [Chromobacterium alticapitis]